MKLISMFKREGVIAVTVATIVSLFLVVSAVQAVTTISTDIATGGALSVTGASTLTGAVAASSTVQVTGNQRNYGTLTVTGASTLTGAVAASSTAQVTGLTTLFGGAESAVTRATGATGSFQNFAGDLTYEGAAGGTSSYHAGVMGNFLGAALTNTNATVHAGTIGKYSVTTSDALVGPKAGLVGEAETSVANSAVMAVLGGDTGTVTPGAAYGVRYLNSTAASKFGFGLDLFSAAVGSYKAVDYGTADIRLQNGETISNGTDGTIALTAATTSFSGDLLVTGNELTFGNGERIDNVTDGALDFGTARLILDGPGPTLSGASSRQTVAADATFSSFTGGYGAGVMGNANAGTIGAGNSIVGGVIGKYNIGTNPSDHPAAGLIGEVGEGENGTADAAIMAVLGGDPVAVMTPGAAYGVRYLNSTAASKFGFGLDLFSAAIDTFQPITYGTADIRLSSAAVITSAAGVPASTGAGANTCRVDPATNNLPRGSLYIDITAGKLHICTATNTWTVVGAQT